MRETKGEGYGERDNGPLLRPTIHASVLLCACMVLLAVLVIREILMAGIRMKKGISVMLDKKCPPALLLRE